MTNITQHNVTNPVNCDAWMFWQAQEQWMFYTQKDSSIPARIQKIRTSHPEYHLWHIDFTHFIAGPPAPLSVFDPPAGVSCTSPSPSEQSEQVVAHHIDRRRGGTGGTVLGFNLGVNINMNRHSENRLIHSAVTVYNQSATNIAAVGQRLISELDASQGIYHTNATLWSTKQSSFHIFATNRTEHCHVHPRETISTTLSGKGAFRVPYSSPIPQNTGDLFVIPEMKAHAFGPAVEDGHPVLVSVMWTPPAGYFDQNHVWIWADDVTIPTTGCKMESTYRNFTLL